MDYFYLDGNYQQQGPVNMNELLERGVTKNTKVWKQGMSDWQDAGAIPELAGLFLQTTPPPVTGYQQSAVPPPQMLPLKPDNLLVWSILTTVLCCLPAGIVAIIQSTRVDSLWAMGDYAGAQKAANNAKMWCFVSLGLGIIVGILSFILGFAGALLQ